MKTFLTSLFLFLTSFIIVLFCWIDNSLASHLGSAGINSEALYLPPYLLTGHKIAIGQVEIGRPAQFGLDKIADWHPPLNFARLFYRNQPARPNLNLDNHAAMVASVMVTDSKRLQGVAPKAKLYSSAVGSLRENNQNQECLTSQFMARQNGGDVRAINFSFGDSFEHDLRDDPKLDGNALLTQCLDWSARVHNVLYVVAGNQGHGGIPIPTDQFNGITTAYTKLQKGLYNKVDFSNLSLFPVGSGRSLILKEINASGRTGVSLLAPGHQIPALNIRGRLVKVNGSSFAAPQVTASVALLQEYGDRQLFSHQPHWSKDARRHEVLKAVLLNSADKLEDPGDGLLLKMNQTIYNQKNKTWLDSPAYQNPTLPIDLEMGAGQLNVFRAYQQFSSGQYSDQSLVPPLGWNYHSLEPASSNDYVLEQPLKQNSFVSVTIAWDRLVELQDLNQNQEYDLGESFGDLGLNQLTLSLLPLEGDLPVCSSVSAVDSLQHLFCPIPTRGRYKIRVQAKRWTHSQTQPYAIAWWSAPAS